MLSLLTPDNLPGVLTAIAAILSVMSGWALFKVRKEPPPPGTPDALLVALNANTMAQKEIAGQFGANLKLFEETVHVLRGLQVDTSISREHLNAIREKL